MNSLKVYLNQLIPDAGKELAVFTSLFSPSRMRKNEYFSREGDYAAEVGFVTQGVLRAFYRNQEGIEYNKTFFTEGHFVAAYSSLITKQQNTINIQCLTECSFLTADFEQITRLYKDHPKIERLARILAEQFFVVKEKREIELVMLDAAERYQLFQQDYPHLENLIPQYQIASYLGVTPTQLSRIRTRK